MFQCAGSQGKVALTKRILLGTDWCGGLIEFGEQTRELGCVVDSSMLIRIRISRVVHETALQKTLYPQSKGITLDARNHAWNHKPRLLRELPIFVPKDVFV